MFSSWVVVFLMPAHPIICDTLTRVVQMRLIFVDTIEYIEAHIDAINITPDKVRGC